MDFLKKNSNNVTLAVLLKPAAKNTKILGVHNARLKIAVTAKAQDNKANIALIKFLSDTLAMPLKNIEIIAGHLHKEKVVKLSDTPFELIFNALSKAISET